MKKEKLQNLIRGFIFINSLLVISDHTSILFKLIILVITLFQIYLFGKVGGFDEE